ncbi:MAG TPA: hypothetical protein VL486_03495 [Verrucomicrobiae bacterium]|nr:hypothetical protein [Verrucomicrobiae bacterium]
MKLVRTEAETKLGDLSKRLFAFKGPQATKLAAQAEAALRLANPQLQGLDKIPAGTLVMVPEGFVVSAAGLSVTPAGPELLEQLHQALAAVEQIIEQSSASETQAVQDTASYIRSGEVKDLIKEATDLQTRLAQIAGQTKTQLREIDTAKTAQLQAVKQLQTDLKNFGL